MQLCVLLMMLSSLFTPAQAQGRGGARGATNPDVVSCDENRDCWGLRQDRCHAEWYCDMSLRVCAENPATEVTCVTVKDTACQKNTCNPRSGECSMRALPASTPCDDGDECTRDDACGRGGTCSGDWSAGDYPELSSCQCKKQEDCENLEDGDVCNGTLYCDLATSQCLLNPSTLISCPSVNDSICSKNQCEPETGACRMTAQPDGAPCDDANVCTYLDVCDAGSCSSGEFVCECAEDSDCEDEDLCEARFCNKQVGQCAVNPAKSVSCQAGLTCEPSTGECVR